MKLRPRILYPRTLWGQTLAITVAAVLLAQVLSLVLFNLLVLRPELQRVVRATAQSLAAISRTVDEVPPPDRPILIRNLNQSGWLELRPGSAPPDDSGPRPRLLERAFMRELARALGDDGDLYWRTDRHSKLWMRVQLGDAPYWISVRDQPKLGPTGLMLLCALISATLAALVASSVSFRLLKPLHALKMAAESMTLSGLPAPVGEDGPEDIAAVSHSFNRMTRRLRDADAERSLILAGISHDVRTPLAKLKLAFAMMNGNDPALMASAERQIDSIDRVLTQFLTFARGYDAEAPGSIDVAALLDDIVETYGDRGVGLTGPPPPASLSGRPEALRRALINLVENAVCYGRAPVELSAIRDAANWVLAVRDHGAGVGPGLVERLREPFVRGDAARSPDQLGTGLGLAIADRVARLHGGELVLRNLDDGFEAALRLPAGD